MKDKNLTLHVYETDADNLPLKYDVTNSNQPKRDCLSFRISLKESLQVNKLKIVFDDFLPKIEHLDSLDDVREGEFGYELVEHE